MALVAEATMVTLQTMAEARVERTQNAAGLMLGGLAMKQPTIQLGSTR